MAFAENYGLSIALIGLLCIVGSLIWLWRRPLINSVNPLANAVSPIRLSDEELLRARMQQARLRERELRSSSTVYQVFAYAIVGTQAGIGFVIALPHAKSMMNESSWLLNLLGACIIALAIGQAIRPGQKAEMLRMQCRQVSGALRAAEDLLAGDSFNNKRVRRASRDISHTLTAVETALSGGHLPRLERPVEGPMGEDTLEDKTLRGRSANASGR